MAIVIHQATVTTFAFKDIMTHRYIIHGFELGEECNSILSISSFEVFDAIIYYINYRGGRLVLIAERQNE